MAIIPFAQARVKVAWHRYFSQKNAQESCRYLLILSCCGRVYLKVAEEP
jgi:hypothetical protein